MDTEIFIKMATTVIGGLGLFLLGMKNLSDGLQAVAGDGMRKIIHTLTVNRFTGVIVGTLITCLVQSSSVTTVMVVGLVNSSLMTLTQAIGVIMGANVGTTITGWILVLKIGKYGLPIAGMAALFYLFGKGEKVRFWGMFFLGLGLVFFGLSLMKSGFKPLQDLPAFQEWFVRFSADTYGGVFACILVGCILTMIVQSSSATLGITMGLASTGAIPFTSAAALVLGENIGTTITATLASIGTHTVAKRAARVHLIFNLLGVLWIFCLFPVYMIFIQNLVGADLTSPAALDNGQILKGIALSHSCFNLTNVVVFLPFVGVLEKIVCRLVPDKKTRESRSYLTYINLRMLEAPAIAIEQSAREIQEMGHQVLIMLERLREVFATEKPPEKSQRKVFEKEEMLDMIQQELVTFLTSLMGGNISTSLVDHARRQIRLADEYESISDYGVRILKVHLRLIKSGQNWAPEESAEILKLHERFFNFSKSVVEYCENPNPKFLVKLQTEGPSIRHSIRQCRTHHLNRLTEGKLKPLESTSFTDILNGYRRMLDHTMNILEEMTLEVI